jgi:hypothetical protein
VNIQVNIREYSREFSEFFAGLRPAAYAGHYLQIQGGSVWDSRWHPNKSVRKIRNGSKTSNQAEIRAFPEIYGTETSGRHAGASLGSGGQPADELRHVEYLGW